MQHGKISGSQSGVFTPRVLISFVLCSVGLLLALLGFGLYPGASSLAQGTKQSQSPSNVQVVTSYHNDISPPLRDLPAGFIALKQEHEGNLNPKVPNHHVDSPDHVIQRSFVSSPSPLAPSMPSTIFNFDGIPFPGVACNCAPSDTDGAVGKTQYVQIVNEGYQVFAKSTGNSVSGPNSISSLWTGFGGLCETNGNGDPIVLYDHLADRWIISQFAGTNNPTDECIAVSTSSDATGSYNRYGFHLGSSFFDYPKLSVWPDGYYMSMVVFNSNGSQYLGPQPFAFDRAKMLAGQPLATFITVSPLGDTVDPILPADLDGSTLPPAGAPETFVGFPGGGQYITYHFHVDFATPANSTFTSFASPAAAGFTTLCPTTRSCVPQSGTTAGLDGIGDRLMARLPYRNFGKYESVVGTYSVSANGVAGVRWFELRNVTAGPVTVFQESTYQPDTTWRWLGSAAMDGQGNLAIGFSASSASIHPQIRYAGRLEGDPLNTLSQREAHLFDGAGSQTDTSNRWGDYSALSVDPVDDRTFWYTNEYYGTTGSFNWRTRIASFKFISPLSAVSEKTHGGAGTFDVNLPLVPLGGNVGVECRSGGATNDYQMIVTFGTAVTVTGTPRAQVTSGVGQIGTGGVSNGGVVGVSGSVVTVPLTNVANVQRLSVTLFGVNDGTNTGNVAIPMGVLIGDVDANTVVDGNDVSGVQSHTRQTANGTNFRYDVDANGVIDGNDVSTTQGQTRSALP